jgi:hypothetical protein
VERRSKIPTSIARDQARIMPLLALDFLGEEANFSQAKAAANPRSCVFSGGYGIAWISLSRPVGAWATTESAVRDPRPALRSDLGFRIAPFWAGRGDHERDRSLPSKSTAREERYGEMLIIELLTITAAAEPV